LPTSLILESSSYTFLVIFLLVIIETLDFVSASSLFASRIEAMFVGFLLGEIVCRDFVKAYSCFDEVSNINYFVPLNLKTCDGR
jgi:hypothetical protein